MDSDPAIPFAVISACLEKGQQHMSSKRVLCGAALLAALTGATMLTVGASAAPAKHDAGVVKLGFITKFPVDF
jgi:hypothetical protein